MSDTTQVFLSARRTNPTDQPDSGGAVAQRSNLKGEAIVEPLDPYAICDQGDYYYANDGTMGAAAPTGTLTGEAPIDATAYLKGFILLRNTSDSKRIYLHWLRMQMITIGQSSSGPMGYTLQLDTGTSRINVAGNAVTPVNTNMRSGNTASCTLYMGDTGTDMTTTAASASARIVSQGYFRSVTPVAADTYMFRFGRLNPEISHIALGSTGIAQVTIDVPPVVLGYTDQMLLHLGTGSQAAHHHIFCEMGFWQR